MEKNNKKMEMTLMPDLKSCIHHYNYNDYNFILICFFIKEMTY